MCDPRVDSVGFHGDAEADFIENVVASLEVRLKKAGIQLGPIVTDVIDFDHRLDTGEIDFLAKHDAGDVRVPSALVEALEDEETVPRFSIVAPFDQS